MPLSGWGEKKKFKNARVTNQWFASSNQVTDPLRSDRIKKRSQRFLWATNMEADGAQMQEDVAHERGVAGDQPGTPMRRLDQVDWAGIETAASKRARAQIAATKEHAQHVQQECVDIVLSDTGRSAALDIWSSVFNKLDIVGRALGHPVCASTMLTAAVTLGTTLTKKTTNSQAWRDAVRKDNNISLDNALKIHTEAVRPSALCQQFCSPNGRFSTASCCQCATEPAKKL